MIRNILLPVLLAGSFCAHATFVPVTLNGFNHDAIANGVGNASASTTLAVDQSNWNMVAPTFKALATDPAPTAALPANGVINSVITSGLTFQLGNYSANNDLILTAASAPSTLTFATPCAGDVYVLGFTGNGPTTADIKVNFLDNTSQTFTNITFNDWYYAAGFTIKGFGRVQRLTNALEAPVDDPRMYEQKLTLSAGNAAKGIASITVTKTNATGVLNIVAVTVCQTPIINTQPSNASICKNWNTFFQMAASNASSYRWQVDAGSGFTDINNNAIYSGATTNMLSLTQTPASYNNYVYRCAVKSTCGAISYTDPATLTVVQEIANTAGPTSADMCTGGYAQVNVTHAGIGTGYQWQVKTQATGVYVNLTNAFPYSGTNTSKLEIAKAPDSLKGAVLRCIVTGGCNTETSADVPVNMAASAFISQDPANMTIMPYANAFFEIMVDGSNQYQLYWQSSTNGADFVNINDNSLYDGTKGIRVVVKAAQPSLSGMKLRCILKSTNPMCSALRDTSEAAELKIETPGSVGDQQKDAYGIALYPNPLTGNDLFLAIPAGYVGEEADILVTDVQGRNVYNKHVVLSANENVVLPRALAPGAYILHLKGNAINSSYRFVRQ